MKGLPEYKMSLSLQCKDFDTTCLHNTCKQRIGSFIWKAIMIYNIHIYICSIRIYLQYINVYKCVLLKHIYFFLYIYRYINTSTSNTHCMGVLIISLELGHFFAIIPMVCLPLVARRSNPGGRKSVLSKVVELPSCKKIWLHAEIEHRFIFLRSFQEEHKHK